MTRDLDLAEDLAQDALVAALQQWPTTGVPDNPRAWLMQTAKRRAVDHFRRADTLRRRTAELGHALAGGGGDARPRRPRRPHRRRRAAADLPHLPPRPVARSPEPPSRCGWSAA